MKKGNGGAVEKEDTERERERERESWEKKETETYRGTKRDRAVKHHQSTNKPLKRKQK